MRKIIITILTVLTILSTSVFAEGWRVEYDINSFTSDELYTYVIKNPNLVEFDRWLLDNNGDNYIDPYWDNEEFKTALNSMFEEAKTLPQKHKWDRVIAFITITPKDKPDDYRIFVYDLKQYTSWEVKK